VARKRKQKAAAGPPGAPEWIVTFTDMISLLVTFFVLLMTFSSIEDFDRLKVDGWLGSTRGVLRNVGGHLAREAALDDIVAATDILRGADVPHTRPPEALQENIEEMGQRETEDHLPYDFNDIADGLQIRFGDDCAFAPGSTEVNEELRRSLGELARILQHYPHLVVVEGYTDAAFRPTPRWPTAEALSVGRARAAVRTMLAESELSPRLLQLAGRGTESPRADDATPEGRRSNRRVEVRVISLSRARVDFIEAERERRRSEEG